MSTATASKAVNQILAAFENGNLPQAIAYSTFTPPANIPAYRWTARNRALAFLQMTGDARGYQQWKEAGRNVKKGSKAIYILGPVMKKSNPAKSECSKTSGTPSRIRFCTGNYLRKNAEGNSPTASNEVIEIENPETGEIQTDNMKCVGYHSIPVFRMEDTEGEPLQYAQLDTKALPLADVAERWGLEIKAGSFNGEYLGYFSSDKKEIVLATDSERTFIHELAHSSHYRIDPKAAEAPKWEKEIIAEFSASAILYMLGKDGHIATHFDYIQRYAEQAKLTPVKACMKLLDTCLKVIDAIVSESNSPELQKVA